VVGFDVDLHNGVRAMNLTIRVPGTPQGKGRPRFTRTGLFRFVRHHDVDSFHRSGWMIVDDLGAHHGRWSVLMWHCECGGAS
jgi:hypothetical protein